MTALSVSCPTQHLDVQQGTFGSGVADPGIPSHLRYQRRYNKPCSHFFFLSLCLSVSVGPGWGESSSKELEGDCHRPAGHPGGLLSHHHVCYPPHTR